MPLTDPAIRNAKPAPSGKPLRIFDGGGLYLEISPAGGKLWRWKYRIGGKEKRLSIGTYPEVNLKAARSKRDNARELLASGGDPGAAKKGAKLSLAGENSFETVAREWHTKFSPK